MSEEQSLVAAKPNYLRKTAHLQIMLEELVIFYIHQDMDFQINKNKKLEV